MLYFAEVPYKNFFTITFNGKMISPFKNKYTKNRNSMWMRHSDAVAAIMMSFSNEDGCQSKTLTQSEL